MLIKVKKADNYAYKKNKLFIIVIHQRLTKQQRYYETKNLKKKKKTEKIAWKKVNCIIKKAKIGYKK